MPLLKLLCVAIGLGGLIVQTETQNHLGALASEGSPERSQRWLLQSRYRVDAARASGLAPIGQNPQGVPRSSKSP